MTFQNEIINDEKYVPVLDHGFVGLVDYMGSDAAIVQAARVSYGDGTKTVNEDRGLIRYLMRHKHTSPIEMCDIKLHLKLPIFVMRQLVRHRTSSLNEYSARYSILTSEMYIPEVQNIKPQSKTNKQGRDGDLNEADAYEAQRLIMEATENSNRIYRLLLNDDGFDHDGFSDEYPENGISREIARTVMPVAGYTELYWKQNLHNLFHMLKLREDSHAQWEIQEFARAIYKLIQPLFPIACEAYEDYIRDSKSMSGMEVNLLRDVISLSNTNNVSFVQALEIIRTKYNSDVEFRDFYRLTIRELNEFKGLIGL